MCVRLCMCLYTTYAVSQGPEDNIRSSELELQEVVSRWCRCWEAARTLQEQQVFLTTEQSLYTCLISYFITTVVFVFCV